MAIMHKSTSVLEVKKELHETQLMGSIVIRIIIAGMIFLVTQMLASESVYNTVIEWSQDANNMPTNTTLGLLAGLGLMLLYPIQLFLKFIVPVCLLVWLVNEIRLLTHSDHDKEIIEAGIEGEHKALDLLSSLPDSYHIFTNLNITYLNRCSELDIIVVGPTGVYIAEVKNYSGILSGDWNEEYLKQVKGKHSDIVKNPYNPLKQVGTHIFRLSNALRRQGLYTWVEGCVLFTSEDLELRITDYHDKAKNIYTHQTQNSLLEFILNNKKAIPQEITNKTVTYLESFVDN